MKPSLSGMDEKSANVAVVMQPAQSESVSSKRSNKRLVIGVVSGISLVLIVVAAILAAVFLGGKIAKEAQKEAWLNYQDKNGVKNSEHAVATDREEDYTVPNEFRVIYDFEKGYAVYKLERSDDDKENSGDYNICYVSHLNRTNLARPQQVKDAMADSEIDVPSNPETEEFKYESTGQEFDRALLSPRARQMCKDSKVVWMAKRTDETRDRRAICATRRCIYYFKVHADGSRTYLGRVCFYFNFRYC